MTASAAQIAQLRRMVAEPTTDTYSDDLIQGFIEAHPLMDELGTEPYYWTKSGSTAPTKTDNDTWYPTYDMNAAAADVWEEKAAGLSIYYDYSADGGNYAMSQAYEHAQKRAKYYRSRSAISVIDLVKKPDENALSGSYIGNLPEPD